jgi:hypothetical protein
MVCSSKKRIRSASSHAKAHRVGSQKLQRLFCASAEKNQLNKGVTPLAPPRYNDPVMSMVSDAAQQTQFASARVLAALPGVPAALSVKFAFAPAS